MCLRLIAIVWFTPFILWWFPVGFMKNNYESGTHIPPLVFVRPAIHESGFVNLWCLFVLQFMNMNL